MRVLLTTVPSAEVAETLVATLVAEQLIACGTITMPVTSIYRWEGETQRAGEVLVIMKTTEAAVADLTKRVSGLHPYEVPELLSLPVITGHAGYLDWVRESVAARNDSRV
ncbi:MAG: divalent-cation tolerance protein CutA [Gemmatimonadota bacterium]